MASTVREALSGFPLGLTVTPPDAASERALVRGVALILFHVTDAATAARAKALVASTAALPQPVKLIAIGESGLPEHGLALLRAGAAEYLERPLDLRRLTLLIDVLTIRARLQVSQVPSAPKVIAQCTEDGEFLYATSAPMGRVIDQIRRVAPMDTNVLIQGETGTGKTRLARVIHDLSPRRDRPFLVVNCAALSTTLIESEMFGHVRGAFTGADRDRTGKFAQAAGGTLFLDEVDSLPIEIQAKLLRVVEERVFEPVGTNTSLSMTARLITASNKPLDRECEAGRFRFDLFFRLNVVTFPVPPLREQADVFPSLVANFVRKFGERTGRKITGIAPDAMAVLTAYRWPGNIRELRNAIERAVALRTGGEIQLDDFPDTIRTGLNTYSIAPAPTDDTREMTAMNATAEMRALRPQAEQGTLAGRKADAEATLIRDVLRKNKNNRARTASDLGISRETLYKKLHRYGLFNAVA